MTLPPPSYVFTALAAAVVVGVGADTAACVCDRPDVATACGYGGYLATITVAVLRHRWSTPRKSP